MSTMSKTINRAVTFIDSRTPATITSKEIDLDSCYDENEIVIKVRAAALNPIDLLVHALYFRIPFSNYPKTYSRDYAGVIVRSGQNVDAQWKIGDQVNGCFFHMYGESGSLSNYLILNPAKQQAITHMAIPPNSNQDPFVINAAWPLVFGTAYSALFDYGQKLGPDSKILVIGASTSVSYALIHIAKRVLHVKTVVGICSTKSIERNKVAGFDYLVPYDQGPVTEEVGKLLVGDLANEKFDLIFDSVGNNDFFPVIDKFLKPKSDNGEYVTIAGEHKIDYRSPNPFTLSGARMLLRIVNPLKGYNTHVLLLPCKQEYMKVGSQLISEGKYAPLIDSVYEFNDFEKAIDRLKSNHCKGKVVVKVTDD
ncbi:YIM1 (YMR152W) [Zygosaccharomyces parabailii]|nr:YIM1 (YMR152W) [Zygosaccharomyces parabailii]